MYRLRLSPKTCLSCGVCEDVCAPHAIAFRPWRGVVPEGATLSHLKLGSRHNEERGRGPMGAFPFLAAPARCDGCRACVAQCPVTALELMADTRGSRGPMPTAVGA